MNAQPVRFDTVPAEARPFSGRPAGIVTRVLANVIDVAVVVLLVAGAYLAVAGVWFLRKGADFRFPVVSFAEAYIAGVITLVVYFTLTWSGSGRTYGDRVLGLRVRTVDGRDLSFARALLRAILCAAFPLLLAWVAISPASRSVQDVLVRTKVIYDWGGTPKADGSDDPAGVAVNVAAPVAHEPDDRDAEALPRVDRE